MGDGAAVTMADLRELGPTPPPSPRVKDDEPGPEADQHTEDAAADYKQPEQIDEQQTANATETAVETLLSFNRANPRFTSHHEVQNYMGMTYVRTSGYQNSCLVFGFLVASQQLPATDQGTKCASTELYPGRLPHLLVTCAVAGWGKQRWRTYGRPRMTTFSPCWTTRSIATRHGESG